MLGSVIRNTPRTLMFLYRVYSWTPPWWTIVYIAVPIANALMGAEQDEDPEDPEEQDNEYVLVKSETITTILDEPETTYKYTSEPIFL